MSAPVAINVTVDGSAVDLYTAGSAKAQLTTLAVTNTSGGVLTIDIWKRNSTNTTSWYIAYTLSLAAGETKSLNHALVTFTTSGEKLRAQASGTSIDVVGSVIEY